MKKFVKYSIVLLCAVFANMGCRKFLTVDPPRTQMVGTAVYSSDATASAALTGILQNMSTGLVGGGAQGLSIMPGLSADELSLHAGADIALKQIYTNSLDKYSLTTVWSSFYNYIYQANVAIEGISSSSGMTNSMKRQLLGEAKFVRAFCYFYLTELYGDVPLVVTTDYKVNAKLPRTSKQEVYKQIISDLIDAKDLLTEDYRMPDGQVTIQRVRPNKGSATALLARAYLYQQDWEKAEAMSTLVINSTRHSLLADLNKVFLANSIESIWQLQIANSEFATPDGFQFLVPKNFGGPSSFFPITLNDSVAYNFELGDLRKTNWAATGVVGSNTYFYPYKYKSFGVAPPSEYPTVLRLAEQYLIRAEARAKQDNISGAQADLNVIRNRAGLLNTTASTREQLLLAILKERRQELFSEYGHRWFDLKRTGKIDHVMSVAAPLKGGTWNSSWQLYPIPFSQIQLNSNLIQNPDY